MRIAIAIFMILHGIAHLPGFIVSWRLATLKDLPYKTTLLSGRLDVGDMGMRILGALWLAAAIAFVLTGIAAIADRSWWISAAISVSMLSLILSVLSLPEARIGLIANIAILVVMFVSRMTGWLNTGSSEGMP